MAAILHKIQRGETLMSIRLVYGIEHDHLVDLNIRFLGMDEPDLMRLKPGGVLVIGDSADPIDLVRVLRVREGR